jgi:hypothetical protein
VPYLSSTFEPLSVDVKRDLARRLGAKYAHIMQTTPDLVGDPDISRAVEECVAPRA